jgi:hypothetical protein
VLRVGYAHEPFARRRVQPNREFCCNFCSLTSRLCLEIIGEKPCPHRVLLLFETVLSSAVSKSVVLFLKWLSRWLPLHPPLKCGRDYLPEEISLSYGDLFQTKGNLPKSHAYRRLKTPYEMMKDLLLVSYRAK